MRTLEQLLKTKRMYYSVDEPINRLAGLKQMIDEIVKPDFQIAEVGCFAGVSSELFAQNCNKLFCIDIWGEEDPAYSEIKKSQMTKGGAMFDKMSSQYENIVVLPGFSAIIAKLFPDKGLDLVYVDANHAKEKVKEDIRAWWPKIKQGGWLTGHDMWYPYVKEAVEELLGTNYKTYPDTSWAIRKQVGMFLK
jgi:predicted O-methyltransferase YrrM